MKQHSTSHSLKIQQNAELAVIPPPTVEILKIDRVAIWLQSGVDFDFCEIY